MSFTDMKGRPADDLKKQIGEKRKELFGLKMKHSMGQLANPLEVRGLRREIARVQTALRQKVTQG